MKLSMLSFLFALLLGNDVQPMEQKKQFTFVTVENVDKTQELYDKVAQAYGSLNYRIELIAMPSKRALVEAMKNRFIDGDLVRASVAQETLTDYIKIPVPIYAANIKAYVLSDDIFIKVWEDLYKYEIVAVRGILATNQKLTSMGINFKLVSQPQQALEMVRLGRADVAIIIAESIENDTNLPQLSEQFPYSIVIEEKLFYHFIHKKHEMLVPELTEAFKLTFADVDIQD